MSVYTGKTLNQAQKDEATRRAGIAKITEPAHVLILGAETQRKMEKIDPEVTELMMKDLGPVGDLMVAMQDRIGELKAEEVLNMEPSWLDRVIERFSWLRKQWGPLARFAKRYMKLKDSVAAHRTDVGKELNGLISDVTLKESLIKLYQEGEIELLIEARVGEILLEGLETQKKELEGLTEAGADQKLANLNTTIQILTQRVGNLRSASNLINQGWVAMETSRASEWSLVEKTDSGAKLDGMMFNQAARAAASALRMARVADLQERADEFRGLLALTVSELQAMATKRGASVGSRAIVQLAILQKTKETALAALREQHQIFTQSRDEIREADQEFVTIREELQQALRETTVSESV